MKKKPTTLTRLSRHYLRPTRPVRVRRRSRWWRWLLFGGMGIILILGWTWRGVYVDALRIRKADLTNDLYTVSGSQKHLKHQLITVRSFTRIDKLAREQLRMQFANQEQRILVVPGIDMESSTQQEATDDELIASVQ